jgi:type I restriction enzyme M protein
VEIIEPYHGRIYDPACGSGGMFVQSAGFVNRHKANTQLAGTPMQATLAIYGQERAAETVRLCKMNLAVHGLAGDIRQANSYYEDLHSSPGKFDFLMANPPFNVNNIDKERIKDDTKRFPFVMPRPDNGNYIWIQLFYSALNETGRSVVLWGRTVIAQLTVETPTRGVSIGVNPHSHVPAQRLDIRLRT